MVEPFIIEQVSGIPDAGPRRVKADMIILHHTGIPADEAIKLFKKSRGRNSSHYLVTKEGKIYQLIADDRLANHLSSKQQEKWRSIGIEMENSGRVDDPYTPIQYRAIEWLKNRLQKKHGIPNDHAHNKGHYEVDYKRQKNRKWDPSPNFDWAQIGLAGHPTLKTIMKTEADCRKFYDLWERGCQNNCAKYNMKVGDYATGQSCKIIFAK